MLEYEAKKHLKRYGIPVPRGLMTRDPGEAGAFTEELGGPVALKAQIPTGGRGRAGGVKFADAPREAVYEAHRLIGSKIKGFEVGKILVEEKIEAKQEIYLGITIDRTSKSYLFLTSKEGGIDIEIVARETPEKIISQSVDPLRGLKSYHANNVSRQLGYHGSKLLKLSEIIQKLYTLAWEMDAELTEINPLVETDEDFIALDARLNLDDNALFRQIEVRCMEKENGEGWLTEREREARRLGIIFHELDGNIGIMGNGAGLTMATMDMVKLHGGRPGNFLDLGGGATPEIIPAAIKLVIDDPRIDVILINILGGITKCDDIAEGIVKAASDAETVKPLIVRIMGTREEEGKQILNEADIRPMETMEEAAKQAVLVAERG